MLPNKCRLYHCCCCSSSSLLLHNFHFVFVSLLTRPSSAATFYCILRCVAAKQITTIMLCLSLSLSLTLALSRSLTRQTFNALRNQHARPGGSHIALLLPSLLLLLHASSSSSCFCFYFLLLLIYACSFCCFYDLRRSAALPAFTC